MNFIDDEPRKHPKPVPFCQSSVLHPTVPEVSLLLQEKVEESVEKKTESFTGTEFQTYNAWRWKFINSNDRVSATKTNTVKNDISTQNYGEIKDKYCLSEIEKRKNEILYGQCDEPRRPLSPRARTEIPKLTESIFSSKLLNDSSLVENEIKEKYQRTHSQKIYQNRNTTTPLPKTDFFKEELDSSKKLYKIIAEQNKQMEVLQRQIEQLLKLQEVKDNQIGQLLKSQESKEKKIEQLMLSSEAKDKEIDRLTKSNEKQEQQLQKIILSQEAKQKENLELLKKLDEVHKKERCSIGVLTQWETVEKSTNTSFDYCVKEKNSQSKENINENDISSVRGLNETNGADGNKSFSLCLSDLPRIQEHIPSPQGSIHLDFQDFQDSSDESNEESGNLSNNPSSVESVSNPLGYTFYNNVLTQVKDIIQNSGGKKCVAVTETNKKDDNDLKSKLKECDYITDERGAMQSFQAWGLFEQNIPHQNERFLIESTNVDTDTYSPSDISIKINALAMKYLKKEQISQYDIQPPSPNAHHRDVTIYKVTNLSIGSMRYLDRHQVLPKISEPEHHQKNIQPNGCSPAELLRRKKKVTVQENLMSVGNILDISTLNRQPKLL